MILGIEVRADSGVKTFIDGCDDDGGEILGETIGFDEGLTDGVSRRTGASDGCVGMLVGLVVADGLIDDDEDDDGASECFRVGIRDGTMILGGIIGTNECLTDGVTVRPTIVGLAVTVGFRVGFKAGTSDGLIEGVVDGTSVGFLDELIEGYASDDGVIVNSTEGL
jgi:hypothetical protein